MTRKSIENAIKLIRIRDIQMKEGAIDTKLVQLKMVMEVKNCEEIKYSYLFCQNNATR